MKSHPGFYIYWPIHSCYLFHFICRVNMAALPALPKFIAQEIGGEEISFQEPF